MKSKTTLVIALAVLAVGAFGANNAQAHRYNGGGGSYDNGNNNGNDYTYSPTYNHYGPHHWNNGFWTHHRHQHFFDNSVDNPDVAINAPQATDNSGDIKNVDTESQAKLNCDTKTICQGVNTNVFGNGNTVIVNTNAAGQQDGGTGY
jgi:hypothetical protein